MLSNQTHEQLISMKLNAMSQKLQELLSNPNSVQMSSEELIGFMVQHQWEEKHNKKINRRLAAACLRYPEASMESIDYSKIFGIDTNAMRRLSYCRWIKEHHNIILTGPTGAGKSFLLCALANQACRQGFTAMYYRPMALEQAFKLARGTGKLLKFFDSLIKVQVLILDDWFMTAMSEQMRQDLFEVIESRYGRGSTLIGSQMPIKQWYEIIENPTVADALLDRLMHNTYKLNLVGGTVSNRESLKHRLEDLSQPIN